MSYREPFFRRLLPSERKFLPQTIALSGLQVLASYIADCLRPTEPALKLADRRVNSLRVSLQFPPHLPLLVPVERFGDGAKVGLFDRVTALGGSGEEEDLFLNVGGWDRKGINRLGANLPSCSLEHVDQPDSRFKRSRKRQETRQLPWRY